MVVDFDDLVFRLPEAAAEFGIKVVGIGDDGVEAVVAAVHLDDDEDVVFAGFGGHRGAGDELRNGGTQGQQRGALERTGQELASAEHGGLISWLRDHESHESREQYKEPQVMSYSCDSWIRGFIYAN